MDFGNAARATMKHTGTQNADNDYLITARIVEKIRDIKTYRNKSCANML